MDLNKIRTNFILAHEEYSKYLDDPRTVPCKLCLISNIAARDNTNMILLRCTFCTLNHPDYWSTCCTKMETFVYGCNRTKIDVEKAETLELKIKYNNIVRRKSFHKQAAAYLRTLSPDDFAPDKMHIIGKKLWELDNQIFKFETHEVKNK